MTRWEKRVKSGQVDGTDRAAANKDCKGKAALTKLEKGGNNIIVRWMEGINTLVVREMRISPPPKDAYAQLWNFTLAAEFTDLHIWLKVMLNGEPWDDDYMCCDNPFRVAIRVSALCTDNHGFFSPVSVSA